TWVVPGSCPPDWYHLPAGLTRRAVLCLGVGAIRSRRGILPWGGRPRAILLKTTRSAIESARPWSTVAATTSTALAAIADTFGERQQSQVPCALDGDCQRALMLGAGAYPAARFDLAAVGDEAPQERDILVINVHDAFSGQRVHPPACERAATTAATATKPARRPAA